MVSPFIRCALLSAVLPLLGSCATGGGTGLPPVDPPQVTLEGDRVVRVAGQQVWAVLDFGFAAREASGTWMLLQLSLTGADGRSVGFPREAMFLRSPSGGRIPLPSAAEVNRAGAEIRPLLRRANVSRAPLTRFPASRRYRDLQLFPFAQPTSPVFNRVELSDREAAFGWVVFPVDRLSWTGRWVLGIDLDEGRVRIPFEV